MFLPNALLKALAQIRPEQAMAEGSGAVWTMQVSGNHDDGRPFITAMFTYAGGVGARASKARSVGAARIPTGVAAVPIEVVEASAPIRFLRKELRAGSRRQRSRRSVDSARRSSSPSTPTRPWQLNAVTSRLAVPPDGIFGGEAGAAGAFTVNGNTVTTQARVTLQPGDVVRLDSARRRRLRRGGRSDCDGRSGERADGGLARARRRSRRVATRRFDARAADQTFLVFEALERSRRGVDVRRVRSRSCAAVAHAPAAITACGRRVACTLRSPTRRRSSRCGWRARSSARGWCRPIPMAHGTRTRRPHRPHRARSRCVFASSRASVYRAAAPDRPVHVVEVDEDDVDLGAVRCHRVRRLADASRCADRLAVMFTSGTTGGRRASRSRRPTTHSPARSMAEARAACRHTIASSSCCRCSTPTRSTTRSPRRSGPGPSWR